MSKKFNRGIDEQQLEGGGAGAGIGGTKWSSMPSLRSNATALGDIKKMASDTSHLKGGAKSAADEAKGRAAKRTAVRAAGAGAIYEGTKAAADSESQKADKDEDSFKEVERSLRAADEDIESSKYGKGDKLKSGGAVKGWGKARGARKAKMY